MIISKTTEIKVNAANFKHYKQFYDPIKCNQIIEVKINELTKTSVALIKLKCDNCDLEKEITFKNYTSYGYNNGEYLCRGCKLEKNNLEKYGVKNVFQVKEVKEKIKETNLEKYGVEFISQNVRIQNKIKETNLEKYGFEHHLKNTNILNKQKNTNISRYNTKNVSTLNNIKRKKEKTCFDNYGVNFYTQSEESKKNTIIGNHPNYIRYLDNTISVFKCDNGCDHEFEIFYDNFSKRVSYNTKLCTVCYPIGDNKSIKEKILLDYIHSIYSGEVISGYRDGIEIDIYLPELKIGIEFNGLYWHSEKFKESNYHINKQIYFREKGIDMKMIYEDDFDNNFNIIKSQINNWLGLTKTKIYARKTQVKQILNIEEYRNFLNNNHIQGYVASKLVYGLYHQDSLVSLMCFDKKEGRINMEETGWNLNRFCNLLDHQVIGGASKLLNHFIKTNNPSRIISYADKDWSNGNLYDVLGFKLVNESKPDYKYVVNGVRMHKQNFTKAKLEKLGHDISLTETQIMGNLGISRIYDCGKMKFEKYV